MAKDEKQFDLKGVELQMVSVLQNSYFSSLSNFLSFVALERLSYKVTENTRFRVEDGKIYITEIKDEEGVAV